VAEKGSASRPTVRIQLSPAARLVLAPPRVPSVASEKASFQLSLCFASVLQGGFHCIPIVKDGIPVGIVTDRDVHACTGHLDQTEASKVMSEALITVSSSATIREAARLLRECKIGALPVVEDGKLTA
jgi:acetoin utilization protein AcuB